ncbi:MAG TPA: VCBS repeat-containing protein, partial [Candidatus Absconditabacterales bacterium]|nr:VCBS repeat-containing protein [Candidatus Absconditabacterales bacterium]
ANFANGKSVGEATLPYGSHFLINFGDPLLERREKNPKIPDTDFDASIGQTIYADPNKTIFKVLPIDFNNDGSKDLIVVYTDGVIKLVKNYGGTQAYKNLQELMIIAEPIKEIKIGDVDGNGFEDIFIITNNNKGIVYLNDKGIFTVDGKNVCLNVNTEPDIINPNPEDFSNIKQMFVEDMDKDGSIDIISNDAFGDIKVFYGGSTNNGANYLSSITGVCDSNRYTRQKNNYNTIKRFGIKLKNDRYIQDNSLIHRKGVEIPTEGRIEEKEIEAPDTTVGMSEEQMKALKTQAMKDIKDMVANTDMYVAAGSTQLAYTDNPLSTAPIYENLPAEEISYLPINENNDAVSIYKEYSDINGGILRQDDEVVIKTTIISKRNNNKLTYIDQLQGPRSIHKDTNNKITSLILSGNTGGIIVDRNGPEGYQFVLDNIQLNSGATLSFSYRVKYQAPK